MFCDNLSVSPEGHLLFAGQDTVALAKQYGTPLYLMDENRIRENCKLYMDAFKKTFPAGSRPYYASKACSFKQIYRIMQDLGMGTDVVSPGEIYTAVKAGFNMADACFHGNAKTDADIAYAMDCGVGCFVADSTEELKLINDEAARRGQVQKVLLRVTPGIDPHTYAAVATGMVDSKFGVAIETGQAFEAVANAIKFPNIDLRGIHCHVGSMVFHEDVYERASDIMLGFIAEVSQKLNYSFTELDMGGGYGVRYTDNDDYVDIPARIAALGEHMQQVCEKLGISMPIISMEPGRSIVADAGMTLYTVQNVKRITGYKNYVAIDGGMPDNPRFALYGSRYTCFNAGKLNEANDLKCSMVGRCCESGDIIQPDICMPESTCRGDIAAVATTGAYNYSMASNYNRICRPAVVMLKDGESYVAVKRESFADLTACDL